MNSKEKTKFYFKGLFGVLVIYALIGLILLQERSGISVASAHSMDISYLPEHDTITNEEAFAEVPHTCLLVFNSYREESAQAAEQFYQILKDMKVGYDVADLAGGAKIPDLNAYQTCIVATPVLGDLFEDVLTLSDWVHDGGRALIAMTMERDTYSALIESQMGIMSVGDDNVLVDSFMPTESFMVGGGQSYGIVDGFDSALGLQVFEDATVYATTGDGHIPLVWSSEYGKGRFVVDNFGIYEKALRGLYAASYSLLEDTFAWPVLDGAVFYLDDFPSPVPEGDGTYIRETYEMSIADFYANVWWPDLMVLAEKLGIRFTGVIIETYEDDTVAKPERQRDTSRFQYYGNMVLHTGGAIGYHGYNHQPLCLDNIDYGDELPYNTWPSMDQMRAAMQELTDFADEMFPTAERSVYVPPSNVISEEGIDLLTREFPEIRTIASNYFSGSMAFEQEFCCTEGGMIHQPRIVSGGMMDDYMKMVALSELNMHMVFTHFMHPDDLLDEDRGAELGWEYQKNNLYEVFGWLFDAAPEMRRLTGSELSAVIQRYSAVTVDQKLEKGNTPEENSVLVMELGNFFDEAHFYVRLNDYKPVSIKGGSITQMTPSLYLLTAEKDHIEITLED